MEYLRMGHNSNDLICDKDISLIISTSIFLQLVYVTPTQMLMAGRSRCQAVVVGLINRELIVPAAKTWAVSAAKGTRISASIAGIQNTVGQRRNSSASTPTVYQRHVHVSSPSGRIIPTSIQSLWSRKKKAKTEPT